MLRRRLMRRMMMQRMMRQARLRRAMRAARGMRLRARPAMRRRARPAVRRARRMTRWVALPHTRVRTDVVWPESEQRMLVLPRFHGIILPLVTFGVSQSYVHDIW
jgi:hypothetical protein